jgi:hypothetical protein
MAPRESHFQARKRIGISPLKQDINNVQKKSNAALIHAFSSSKLFLCHDWIV